MVFVTREVAEDEKEIQEVVGLKKYMDVPLESEGG